MCWSEMSYNKYTQTADNREPEVWDDIYEPSDEQFLDWIFDGKDEIFGVNPDEED